MRASREPRAQWAFARVSIDSQRFVKLLECLAGISNRGQDAAQIIMSFEVIGTYAHRGLVVRYRLTVFALGEESVAKAVSGVRSPYLLLAFAKSLSKGELCFRN